MTTRYERAKALHEQLKANFGDAVANTHLRPASAGVEEAFVVNLNRPLNPSERDAFPKTHEGVQVVVGRAHPGCPY